MVRNRRRKYLDLIKSVNRSGLTPFAAFGDVMATHFSLYLAILILPVCAADVYFLFQMFNYACLRCWSLKLLVSDHSFIELWSRYSSSKSIYSKSSSTSKVDFSDSEKSTSRSSFGQFSCKSVLHFILCVFICHVMCFY